jgi:hypothetical protein
VKKLNIREKKMKKFLFGLIAILSMASAHADNERVTTRCGRPELVIQGVVSKRAVENVRRWDENKLIYEIRINGEAIVPAADFELESIVAKEAIKDGADLCEVVKRVGQDNTVVERRLTIRR